MSKEKKDTLVKKEDSTVLKETGVPKKVVEKSAQDDFMERAKKAQNEIAPILEKHEVTIVGQLNNFDPSGITAKAVYADLKKYDN